MRFDEPNWSEDELRDAASRQRLFAAAKALAIAVAGMGTDHDAVAWRLGQRLPDHVDAAGMRVAADARRGHQVEQRLVVGKAFAQVGVQVDGLE